MAANKGAMLPPLDDFHYKAERFIESDSKMSDILLATDHRNRAVVLKISAVEQRNRADVNRAAIYNAEAWLKQFRHHRGIISLLPISRKAKTQRRSWFARPTYWATLTQWPGKPDFLALEYLAGDSLKSFVGNKRLSIELSLWIAHHIARSLAYIHKQNCVHRDIKPENILFRLPPTDRPDSVGVLPVIIDFGVAARRGEQKLVSGSRLWMAPELQDAYGRDPLAVEPAWDVYALGLILCYMLTGRRPRRKEYDYHNYLEFREHTFAIIDKESTESARITKEDKSLEAGNLAVEASDFAPKSKEDLKQLISRALEREPANRPTAQAFAAEAARILESMDISLPASERIRMRLEEKTNMPLPPRLSAGIGVLLVGLFLLMLLGFGAVRMMQPANALDTASAAYTTQTAVEADQSAALAAATTSTVTPTMTRKTVVDQPNAIAISAVAEPTLALDARPRNRLPAATRQPEVDQLPPTLIPAIAEATVPPAPTLISPNPSIAEAAPTRIPLTPAPIATLVPTPTATPTATATQAPTATLPPTALQTATRQSRPLVGRVELVAPASDIISGQNRVEFSWRLVAQPLAADQCFELVFWNPANAADKRSPVGVSQDSSKRVSFQILETIDDPLLSALARSREPFSWGVRIVSCTSPQVIWRDVEEIRAYTYKN